MNDESSPLANDGESLSKNRSKWKAVFLIYRREMIDQLRDRRTLFTVAILPIMLYPLLGMILFQVAQFQQEHPITICVLGKDHLDVPVPLFDGDGFAEEFKDGGKIDLVYYNWGTVKLGSSVKDETTRWIEEGRFDAVLVVPPEFLDHSARASQDVAKIKLYYDVSSDESRVARERMLSRLDRWQTLWIRSELAATGVEETILHPFRLDEVDIAPQESKSAAFWSKMLPFIMLVWALTGAFYPAIDLVAGEKERGTLETLLCSPASRAEIVWGKLGAVATASITTALLNLCSMLLTSSLFFDQLSGDGGGVFSSPPLLPLSWLLVALLPLSLLFSAVALAAAALAKSSKEGQYYLMPLMMISLPLVMIPMLPGIELAVGTSIIPVTGMFLLSRTLIEGDYLIAALHAPAVFGVTFLCLGLALRWAKRQFEDESVLFGSHEPFDLKRWVVSSWRQREAMPTTAASYFCGAVILVLLFLARLSGGELPQDSSGFARMVLVPQIAMVLIPTLAFAGFCSLKPLRALRLHTSSVRTLFICFALGILFHPTYLLLAETVNTVYPMTDQAMEALQPVVKQMAELPLWIVITLIAVTPAICEELAFRGLIFGGLAKNGRNWGAIVVTAILFGSSHGVLQQSICATLMGLLLGIIAYRTGSVLPGILFHFANNAMSVCIQRLSESQFGVIDYIFTRSNESVGYQLWWTIVSFGLAVSAFTLLMRNQPPSHASDERNDANHQRNPSAAL